jgi:hypothetical protein
LQTGWDFITASFRGDSSSSWLRVESILWELL